LNLLAEQASGTEGIGIFKVLVTTHFLRIYSPRPMHPGLCRTTSIPYRHLWRLQYVWGARDVNISAETHNNTWAM